MEIVVLLLLKVLLLLLVLFLLQRWDGHGLVVELVIFEMEFFGHLPPVLQHKQRSQQQKSYFVYSLYTQTLKPLSKEREMK
jgi:hypothetical protein